VCVTHETKRGSEERDTHQKNKRKRKKDARTSSSEKILYAGVNREPLKGGTARHREKGEGWKMLRWGMEKN